MSTLVNLWTKPPPRYSLRREAQATLRDRCPGLTSHFAIHVSLGLFFVCFLQKIFGCHNLEETIFPSPPYFSRFVNVFWKLAHKNSWREHWSLSQLKRPFSHHWTSMCTPRSVYTLHDWAIKHRRSYFSSDEHRDNVLSWWSRHQFSLNSFAYVDHLDACHSMCTSVGFERACSPGFLSFRFK